MAATEEGPVQVIEAAIALAARGLQVEEEGEVDAQGLALSAYREAADLLIRLRESVELEQRAPLAYHACGQALSLLLSRCEPPQTLKHQSSAHEGACVHCQCEKGQLPPPRICMQRDPEADREEARGGGGEGDHGGSGGRLVAGLDSVKELLSEAFVLPARYPHLFRGVRRPDTFILLHGAPGTGKTLLVDELARSTNLPLLAVKPSSILSKWSGEAERALGGVFAAAKQGAERVGGSIVFLDEIDAFGMARDASDDASQKRLLTELLLQLTELDRWNERNDAARVGVIGATNVKNQIDQALLRRFRCVHVPHPSTEARRDLLFATLGQGDARADLTEGEVLRLLAATEGYTGAEMARLLREAAMAPLREALVELREGMGGGGMHAGGRGGGEDVMLRDIVWRDFEAALAEIRPALLHGSP